MRFPFIFLLISSLVVCQYSIFDKCYRFEHPNYNIYNLYTQYYFNRKGTPIGNDEIVEQFTNKGERYTMHSFYYHRVLSDCTFKNNTHLCTSTIESVWFKITNTTSAKDFAEKCDPIFKKKYADVMKHNCDMTSDPFSFVKSRIGEEKEIIIVMDGNVPIAPSGYPTKGECVWEYEILGIISLVTVILIVVAAVVCLIIFIAILVVAQKHRSAKRQRLANSLVSNVYNCLFATNTSRRQFLT